MQKSQDKGVPMMNHQAAEALLKLGIWIFPALLHTAKDRKKVKTKRFTEAAEAFWKAVLTVPYVDKQGNRQIADLFDENRYNRVAELLLNLTMFELEAAVQVQENGRTITKRGDKVKGFAFSKPYYLRCNPLCRQFFQVLQDRKLNGGYDWTWHRVWAGNSSSMRLLGHTKKVD